MANKYSRRTQQKIDRSRITLQEESGLPAPKQRKPKRQLDEYDNRGYRRSRTYYTYAKDLCEHYLLDFRKHQLCIAKKEYVFMSQAEFKAMTEDIIFLQQCLKTVLRDYNKYFKERFVDRLSIRKYAQEHNLNRGSVDYIQKKMFTALAAELKARDEADGKCRLCDPNTAPKYWD
jgi:DNA-directed RNA polymerase specialized sigma24 family protein